MAATHRVRAIRPTWYAGSSTLLGEFWTMVHLPYTGMVLGFVLLGAAAAPRLSWVLLAGTLIAYFLGLGIGAHFLDQIPGMGSRYVSQWPTRALWVGGSLALATAVGIGIAGSVLLASPLLLVLVGAQALCAVGYPLAAWFGGAFHRDSVFAVSWGSLPFFTSFYAQAQTVTFASLVAAGALGGVALLEIRLSRSSRRLRSDRTSHDPDRGGNPDAAPLPFRRFDTALAILSLGTILVSLAVFAVRLGL
jgi:hypothetical protein